MEDYFLEKLIRSPGWTAYWVAAILVCVAATGMSVGRLKTRRDGHLWRLILLQTVIILELLFNFAAELNWYRPLLSDMTRIGAMIMTSLLIISLTAFIDSYFVTRLHRGIGRFFHWAGLAMAVHYLVSAVIFFVFRYDGSRKYFGGYRYIPAYTVFIILLLAVAYAVAALLTAKPSSAEDGRRVRVLRQFAVALLIIFPFFFILDLVRYFFPALWLPLPEERLFAMPLMATVSNIIFIRYVRKGLAEAPPELKAADALTVRETQVADRLCQGLSYKEIAQKLNISLATVQSHVTNIYRKLGVSTKADLILSRRKSS